LKATHRAEESPEPEIALTVTPGRRAACHSKYIPEARLASKDDLPDSEIATDRPISQYPSKMNPEATRPQARIHGISDRQENHANKAAQGIAGPSVVSMSTDLTFHRSGTGPAGRRAGQVPSLPILAIHPLRQPAIPGL